MPIMSNIVYNLLKKKKKSLKVFKATISTVQVRQMSEAPNVGVMDTGLLWNRPYFQRRMPI